MSENMRYVIVDDKGTSANIIPLREGETVDDLVKCKGCQELNRPDFLDEEGYCGDCLTCLEIMEDELHEKGLPMSIVKIEIEKIKAGVGSKYLDNKEAQQENE